MDFLNNPFYILDATPHDNRRRIMDLEAERILFQDPVKVKRAAETLTKLLPRLSAELAWLPVKNSEQAEKSCELLKSFEANLGARDGLKRVQDFLVSGELMPIAKCNVLAAGLRRLPRYSSDTIAAWILEFVHASEAIDAENLCGIINSDRKVAGFPTAKLPHMETEIENLRDHYRQVMTSALADLSADGRAEAMTSLVEPATDNGKPLPRLIDRLVDWYEVDVNASLEEHGAKIGELDEKLRLAADENRPDSVLASLVIQLTDAIHNWHAVAQPIQINKKIKGLHDEDSQRVAWRVRDLAIHLFNDYNKLSSCQRLIVKLQAVFAEVAKISEVLAEDIKQLEKITKVRAAKFPKATAKLRERRARQAIEMQVQKLRTAADANQSESILGPMVNQLIDSVKKWKTLAQPIKVYNEEFRNVANLGRELALYLWKKHGTLDFARQILEMLQEEFVNLREIAALIARDLKAVEASERARVEVQIQLQVTKLRTAADSKKSDSILNPMVNQIIQSVKEWKSLAQPIKAHSANCYSITYLVRELALRLRNQHGNRNITRQFLKMLQEEFAQIGEISTLIAKDLKALEAPESTRMEIQVQAEKLRSAAESKKSDSILNPMAIQLIQSVKEWKTLAQPVRAYAADYYNVTNLLRELALYLWNEYAKANLSRQLLKMLQEEFAQLDEIANLVAEDLNTLETPERARLDVKVEAEKLRAAVDAKQPDSILNQMVDQFIQRVKEWNALAQPFESYRADYYSVANLVMEMTLHLRQHNRRNSARKLFEMIQEEFAEIDEIAALVTEHLDVLEAADSARRHIEIQVKGLRDAVYAKHYHPDLSPMVNQLVQSVIGWRDLAQPINAYYGEYCGVAKLVSELALSLKKKGKLRSYRQLKKMLQDIFGKIPEIDTLLAEEPKAQDEAEKKYARRNTRKRARWRR